MSLRWTLYVLLTPPTPAKGTHKCNMAIFRLKLHFTWRKSATKFLCVNTVSLSICTKNGPWRTSPTMGKFDQNWPTPFTNAEFQSVFAYSASAITPSDKSSVNTNKKPTVSFPKSLRWKSYVAPKPPPQKGAQNAVSKIWQVICDNFKTVQDRMSVTDTITDRKSHTGFRLVPTLMTLNELGRRNSLWVFFPNLIALLANYVIMVEDRSTMSVKYCLSVPVFHFWP